MKKLICLGLLCAVVFAACKKQSIGTVTPLPASPDYLSKVREYLHKQTAPADYDSVDFSKYSLSKQKAHWYIRFARKNKLLPGDFVLLQTDSLGQVASAQFVQLLQSKSAAGFYNGSITLQSLDRSTTVQSAIINGYIMAWHPGLVANNTKTASFAVPYDELPEVIVTANYRSSLSGSGISFTNYMRLQMMSSGGGSSSSAGVGGTGNPGDGDGGGGNSNSDGYAVYSPFDNATNNSNSYPGGHPGLDEDIRVSFDQSLYRPAIDLAAWLKCFTDIPDEGATCSVTLLGDLPEDTDPSTGLNIFTGNTGHCFLQLQKINGAQSVTQVIGFMPEHVMKSLINPDELVPSKLIDNAGHKYNCAITMYLNGAGFQIVLNQMLSSSDMPYSIVNYDCLDYGLAVFNSVRPGNPLVISKVYDPNDPFSNIANGPKLYTLLEQMKANGSPESANINLSGPKHIGMSHGACN